MSSPARNKGQGKLAGIPPPAMSGQSQQNAEIKVAPPAAIEPHAHFETRNARPVASRARTVEPASTIEAATSAGASTGAVHGTGIRNKTSQVQGDDGQPSSTKRLT